MGFIPLIMTKQNFSLTLATIVIEMYSSLNELESHLNNLSKPTATKCYSLISIIFYYIHMNYNRKGS